MKNIKNMKKLLLLLLAVMLCLTACQSQQPVPEPVATPEPTPELAQEDIINYMALTYADADKIRATYPLEKEIVLPERTFILDTTVSNAAEKMVYDYFYAVGTGNYDEIISRTVNTNLKQAMKSHQAAEEDGIFYEQVILRDLEIVPIESFIDLPYEFCEEVATIGGSYKLTEYAVVGARAEIKHNEKSLAMGPQVGDGEVVRYFLVGKTDGDYYLFEIYWDDFLV